MANNEWYTPPTILEMAREVLGSIELDPASCLKAQQNVGALNYYTKEHNGLDKPWYGTIWCNPPYSRDLIGKFVDKAVSSFERGDFQSCLMLTNSATDTKWFTKLCHSGVVANSVGRISFIDTEGAACKNNSKGQALFLLSKDDRTLERFKKAIRESSEWYFPNEENLWK